MLFFLACTPPDPVAAGDTASHAPRRALVLVLDGSRYAETFGTEASEASSVPGRELFGEFTSEMLPRGTLYTAAVAANVTVTPPGHGDIITGRHNNLALMPATGGAGYYRPEYPTLFEATEEAFPGTKTHLVRNTVHLEGLERSLHPGWPEADGATAMNTQTEQDSSDQTVIDALYEVLGRSRLVVANLHDIDRAGHSQTNEKAYAHGLEVVAPELTTLWDWIESDASGELAGNTLLVVVADHGRHDWEDDGGEDWDYHNHGDQCVGCRDIPIFLAGPGIRAGVELDTPATLEDVGATVAAWLRVPLPHTTGRVLAEAFGSESFPAQAGTAWIAADDDGTTSTVATVEWTGDPAQRGTVRRDGLDLDSSAWIAADPEALALGDGTVTCWRALAGAPDGHDWNWQPRCEASIGGVTHDLVVPASMAAPSWRPSLAAGAEGDVSFAWADNPTAVVETAGLAEVRVATWTRASDWTPSLVGKIGAIYPGNPSLARAGERQFVAWAASDAAGDAGDSINPARYTRHVEVAEVGESFTVLWRAYTEPCPADAGCTEQEPTLDDGGQDWGRMENPALSAREDGLDLAWLSWGEGGATVHVVRSDADYANWGTPTRVDDTSRVLGHVEPRWHGGTLYYARLTTDDTVELCAWAESSTCIDTGASAITDLAATRDGVLALLHRDGAWAVESFSP